MTALRSLSFVVSCATAGVPAAASPVAFLDASGARAPIVGDACEGGLRNDDGSYEGAVGYANAVPLGAYVMALDIPEGFAPARVCLCWTRGPFSNGTDVDFDVVFYAADGEGDEGEPGYPGTFLGRTSSVAMNVPEFAVDGVAMYPVELTPEAQKLSGRIYVGAEWKPFEDRQFFLCNDSEPGGTQLRPVFEGFSNVPPEPLWWPVSEERPSYRAFGTVLYGDGIFDDSFDSEQP